MAAERLVGLSVYLVMMDEEPISSGSGKQPLSKACILRLGRVGNLGCLFLKFYNVTSETIKSNVMTLKIRYST